MKERESLRVRGGEEEEEEEEGEAGAGDGGLLFSWLQILRIVMQCNAVFLLSGFVSGTPTSMFFTLGLSTTKLRPQKLRMPENTDVQNIRMSKIYGCQYLRMPNNYGCF